jgi:demethylmenaquinone methyltransferase / 2-methoxy-6-polyprenyl-1,4-benzoquinol methylase
MVYMSASHENPPKTPAWSKNALAQDPHSVEDKHKRVEQMFTAIARRYDLNNRLHSMWQDQVWRSRAVRAAKLTGNEDVVDVACGTGDLAMAFYKANVRSVIGIDFTQAMLDLAIVKASRSKFDIDFKQGDAMDLQLPDCSADVVSIAFGIRNVQDPQKAFAEFYRILRPKGRLVVLEFSTPRNKSVRFLNNFYTNIIMPLTATLISRDTSGAYKYLPKSIETFACAKELAEEVQCAGFKEVKQQVQTFGVCTITSGIKD